uniref:Uncharacterized protein n=1 Tax=Euplotes harpa TaxID=151035 RepID=A0A7S3JA76_9SPIT|mmetsp:Transcript_25922/g.29930  ORF Transcript_25922/g.29930 Transcript_25922/m.29930 type:complete len:170 (+) Transcript_25922:122-631(+)
MALQTEDIHKLTTVMEPNDWFCNRLLNERDRGLFKNFAQLQRPVDLTDIDERTRVCHIFQSRITRRVFNKVKEAKRSKFHRLVSNKRLNEKLNFRSFSPIRDEISPTLPSTQMQISFLNKKKNRDLSNLNNNYKSIKRTSKLIKIFEVGAKLYLNRREKKRRQPMLMSL